MNTFSTPDKLTDLVQTNPANLRKKDVKTLFLIDIIALQKKPKILLVSMARKEVIKGLRNTPRINTYSIFSIKSLNVS